LKMKTFLLQDQVQGHSKKKLQGDLEGFRIEFHRIFLQVL